jgi:hypothetical protein
MPVKGVRARTTNDPCAEDAAARGIAIAAGTGFPESFAAHICLTFIRAMEEGKGERKGE